MILNGIKGLLGSKKGTLSLIILSAIIALAATGHLEGMSFAAVVASVQALYCWTQSKTDQVSMTMQGPPNGQSL